MMGDVVLVDLNHGPPTALFILETGLSTNSSNLCIICTARHKSIEGIFLDTCISVNHQEVLIEFRIHANDIVNLVEDFQLEWRHWSPVMNTVEEVEEQDLGVTFPAVTRLRLRLFGFLSYLDNHNIRYDIAFIFVQARVHFPIIKLLTAITDRLEWESRRVDSGVNA